MYRIELTPGEVTVFRTIEELATGVRNGLITPKARIYHSASDKWLPIEFHPHYKQALDLNVAHAGDSSGHKHTPTASKATAPKHGSAKSGSSKPAKDGFTFLNVPLSPVTPTPKPKPRLADLPYIQDDDAADQQPAPRPSAAHPAIEHPPAYEAPVDSTVPSRTPAQEVPAVPHATARHSTDDYSAADAATTANGSANEPPLERSPGYDLDHQPSLEQPPAHLSPAHQPLPHQPPAQHPSAYDRAEPDAPEYGAPAHHASLQHAPVHEDPPAHHRPFKSILTDETPIYRSPAERSATQEAEAHAAFEAHLHPEPIRIEEPILDAPRSRLAVDELFAPPAPRAPALPTVSTSPVLELPTISYPEITPADPPVAERSSGGSRARRTLHLVGAVMLLAAGGYASTTMFSFGRPDGGFNAASTMADRPVVPVRTSTPSSEVAPARTSARVATPPTATSSAGARSESPRTPSLKVTSTPGTGPVTGSPATAEAPLPPASSGFAPALESRAIVTAPLKPAPKPDPVIDSSALAPAIDMQVTAPELQGTDSLLGAPRVKGDSAMKRILKAVSGKKDAS
jgi:hypothetical protein